MYRNLGKNRLRFKVGDVIKVIGIDGFSFIHIDEIKESNGLTYYYDHTKNRFVNEPIDANDGELELVDDNDETYNRYKLYRELKEEFEG